jgi:L-threonylcarbamoyladenylate synthase
MEDLAGRIDIVLDGGPTQIGVESTVLDMTTNPPQILRPGGTPYERLRAVLGQVKLHPVALAEKKIRVSRARSPGMKYRHYAPRARLIVVEGKADSVRERVRQLVNLYMASGKRVGILTTDENRFAYDVPTIKSLGSRQDVAMAAKRLFALLREFDRDGVDVIIAEGVPVRGLGLAVMNRLRKAAGFNIIRA